MEPNCAALLADLFSLFLWEAKESLLESSISHIVILMILSLSIIKDSRNSPLIFTPKNSPFLRLQNLLQLLLISTYFVLEMRTKTLPPNYLTNVMCLVSTLWITFPFMSSNIPLATVSIHLNSFAMPVVFQTMVTFYHATGPWWQDFCHRVTKLIVCPTHLRNSMADTLI